MLGKIIQVLTKIKENENIMTENVLSWVKRIEVHRAQSDIKNSLNEAKEFDKIKVT